MSEPAWLTRWQQHDDDELCYASLSDLPPQDVPQVPETLPEARRWRPGYLRHTERVPPGRRLVHEDSDDW